MSYKDNQKNKACKARWQLEHADKHREATANWQKKNPEKDRIKNRRYVQNLKENKPEHHLWLQTGRGARKRGIEFALAEREIHIPNVCPILGIPLSFTLEKNNLPTIDRINNTRGYITSNVWVISWRANKLKSDATLDELEKLANALRKLQDET